MRYNNSLILLLIVAGLLVGACNFVLPVREALSDKSTPAKLESLTINKSLLVTSSKNGWAYYQGQPFTGIAIEKNEEGVMTSSNSYNRGRKHGLSQKWFGSGQLSFEANYFNGRKDGTAKSWWSNGQLRSETKFINGTAHGIQTQWYRSGAKFKEQQLAAGKEAGLQRAWRENGKLYSNYIAKDGRIFGLKRSNLCYELENENIQLQAD